MPDIMDTFPIIPHEHAGAHCRGCIVVEINNNNAELHCNECGALVGVINAGILQDLVSLIPTPGRSASDDQGLLAD